jgi:exodeoxyribonuclease VII large subunit
VNTAPTSRPYAVQTVSQVTSKIRMLLEDKFADVAVMGEISNFKGHNSGHWYFSLKDRHATLPCAFFRTDNAGVKFDLQDGLKVIARGRLTVYPPKGGYNLVVTSLEPVGIGQWQLAFEQLKEKLEKEGLLDAARKRPIPLIPKKIGLVTSPTAAALKDVLTALRRRNRNVQIVISPTRVQGEGAQHDIAQAIRDIQKIPDLDVVMITRGGGSIEDLWSFNTEVVARAVASCRVPTISGIGHETDVTICDLVADLRAPTPTAAAEMVARRRTELVERWSTLNRFLVLNMEQRLARSRQRLQRLDPRHALSRQEERIHKMRLMLEGRNERMRRAVIHLLNDTRHRWARNQEKLIALSPLNVLTRGYAIIKKADGSVVYDYSQVKPGDKLEAFLKTGKLKLTVEYTEESWDNHANED